MWKHNKKYKYTYDMRVDTLPSGRTYFTPDGDYPSITTVLGKTANNVWLQAWKDKVGEEEAARISKEATDRGTLVHEYAEHYFNNEDINISDIEIRLIKNKERENQDIVEDFSVYLETTIDNKLLKERISRELVSIIQKQRKDMGFDITDRISLIINSDNEVLLDSVAEFKNYIINETLTTDLEIKNKKGSNKILDYFVDTEIKIS